MVYDFKHFSSIGFGFFVNNSVYVRYRYLVFYKNIVYSKKDQKKTKFYDYTNPIIFINQMDKGELIFLTDNYFSQTVKFRAV